MKETLSNAGIEAAIGKIESFLNELGTQRKSAVRMRLSAEEILLKYQEKLGNEQSFELSCGQKFRRSFMTLTVPGSAFDPMEGDDEYEILRKLMASSGLAPVYSYQSGANIVTFNPPKKKLSPGLSMLVAIIAAVVLGFAGRALPAGGVEFAATRVFGPLSDTFMGVLSAIAGPLIFLAVTCGIYSIGDTATLGRIGKKLIVRLIVFSFILLAVAGLCVLPLFPITIAQSEIDATGFISIYEMILDIAPDNILLPFAEGNPLQIIFIAVVMGFTMLVLNKSAAAAAQLAEQLNNIVQMVMGFVSSLVPVFIFISLTQMILLDQFSVVLQSYKLVLLVAGMCLMLSVVSTAMVCVREKISPAKYIGKLLPTYLICLTTASSAAAFATNIECCVRDLGIDKKLVNFGVPLGQVVFKPGAAVQFLMAVLCMAEVFAVAITPVWLVTAFFITGMLAIAAPPIPGGSLTCYTILFLQLGIPLQALPIVISLNLLIEFPATAANIYCLQSELVLLGGKLGMLDEKALRK